MSGPCKGLLLVSVLACALVLGAATSSSAQCLGPDNLDLAGACCQPVLPTLPGFPQASLGGLGICWNNCAVATTRTNKVSWPAPAQPICAQYTTPLTVTDAITGIVVLTGPMVLDYTRTWSEIDTAGTVTQVWRFAAKADLSVPAAGAFLCPQPPCIMPFGPHPTAFYYGYVDYTSCTAAGPWENALVLYHNCDRFIHMPGLSDRPGAFHPAQSYAIVAPHSTAQPFMPANFMAPGGPLVGEATRNVNNVGPPICTTEDPVISGALTKLGAGCICTLANNPKQQTSRRFDGKTACVNAVGLNGSWTSLNINFPFLPWLHMISTSIGTWTNPAVFPGTEFAWVDEGLFIHQDACTGDFVEIKYGGSTRGGWIPILPVPVPVANFTDVADNYTAPLLGPYPLPILGSIRPTDHLIYVNTP